MFDKYKIATCIQLLRII